MALEFAHVLKNLLPLDIWTGTEAVTEDTLLAEIVSAGSTVLEVLRDQTLSGALAANGCEVDPLGMDAFETAGNGAPVALRESYDVVLLSDVLGHARDPIRLLGQCRKLLADGGFIVAAAPNFGYGALRLALLCGDYDDFMREQEADPRLRFLTLESLENMLLRAGFRTEKTLRRTAPWNGAPSLGESAPDVAVLDRIRRDPEHETLSFVIKTAPIVRVPSAAKERDDNIRALKSELDAALRELGCVTALNDELREAGKALREQLTVSRRNARLAEEMRAQVESALADLSSAIAIRDELLVRVHSADTALVQLNQEREMLAAELGVLRNQTAQLAGEKSVFAGEITKLRGENAALACERAQLAERAEKAERTAIELANDLLQCTKTEIQQLSDLVDAVQRSRFWGFKRLLSRLRSRLLLR